MRTRRKPTPATEGAQIRDTMLVFGAPTLGEAEIQEVVDTLRSGWIGTGPRVARFEQAFADYKAVPSAVALNSCTAALMLSLRAAGIGAGDEVITTPLTFCATANSILHTGAVPVLADVDPDTLNIDPAQIERCITNKTKAILPVHVAGRPCEMDRILELAQAHGLLVIEDCAHAIETEYRGQPAGTLGDYGCFSFYVTKNVVTGEGGMVIAKDEEALSRIKVLALHGMSKDAWKRFSDEGYEHYYVQSAGYKHNMMDLQAALGIHQLARVQSNWELRKQVWERYQQAFAGLPLGLPREPTPDTRHAYHLYQVQIDADRAGTERDRFLAEMTRLNIGTGVHYLSLPEHPYYQQELSWRPEQCPHAARIGRQTVSLPLSPGLTYDDVEDVIAAVRRILT
ncbi:MAG: DegT/DnrJ/EryC1/StrS family aminotransferase [Planctomycetota bacterium]|jgi:dTDP-4-amino-4,6-dideoxygalactose transaminase